MNRELPDLFFSFIYLFISWRLITLQYCSGFCHTLTWISKGETQMYRTDFWTLWEKARVGCFKRTASKHVYYLRWNRSPAQVGCMRQVLGPGALNFQIFKLVLEKTEEPEIKLQTSAGSAKKQENSRKTSTYALLTMPKPFTVWITINCGKLWKRWEYQTTWPASWETCMQFRKQQLELDMEQKTGSK